MANKKAAPAKEKKVTDKDYFDEAKSWDESEIVREKKSARRAWAAFWAMTCVVIVQAIAISTMMPLKTIENSIVRINDTTGETEVISNLKNMDEATEQVMSRYWLAKYINPREGYHWNTREDDRLQVGMLSDGAIQQQYADYTNPKVNPYAPIKIYGETTEVDIKVNPAITYLNGKGGVKPEKGEKDQFGETVYTALVRYTATVKKEGETPATTHWAATISFVYRKEPIKVDDRLINPVGFQVISYRKDQEGG